MKTAFPSQIRRKVNEIELIPYEQANTKAFDFKDDAAEVKSLLNIVNDNGNFYTSLILIDQFYIESVVGLNGISDGTNSPTSKKEETLLDKNMSNMSR